MEYFYFVHGGSAFINIENKLEAIFLSNFVLYESDEESDEEGYELYGPQLIGEEIVETI